MAQEQYLNINHKLKICTDKSYIYSIVIPWATIFVSSTNYATVPFSNPHWNSYLDITGDCQSDIIITDSNNNI